MHSKLLIKAPFRKLNFAVLALSVAKIATVSTWEYHFNFLPIRKKAIVPAAALNVHVLPPFGKWRQYQCDISKKKRGPTAGPLFFMCSSYINR
jgi:hypothetical protein